MNKIIMLVLGILLGWVLNDKTSFYAVNCDESKYGYTFISQEELTYGGFYCYGNENQVIYKAGVEDTISILKMKVGIYEQPNNQ